MNQVGAVATERYFSVVVETGDGKSKALPVRGESSGQAFQQARQQPDVRRVGKVTEISRAVFDAIVEGREPAAASASEEARRHPAERNDKWIGHVIAGPRVAIHDRPSGEQPFKHLRAPPERPKPPKRDPEPLPQPPASSQVVQPVAKPGEPAAAQPAAEVLGTTSPAAEYRILKSRRQDGPPYLLQRGTWQQHKGKRAFQVEWEKDFATRDEAEKARDATQNSKCEARNPK
jgi:hypothetical protein